MRVTKTMTAMTKTRTTRYVLLGNEDEGDVNDDSDDEDEDDKVCKSCT